MNNDIEKFTVDGYTIYSNPKNNKYKITFKNSYGESETVNIGIEIKDEFKTQKKLDKKQKNEFDRHIEHLNLDEYQLNKRSIHKVNTVEEIVISNERINEILKAIWDLPSPQNRRVYMRIVERLSITNIAKIEDRAIPVVKRSIDKGIQNIIKILKI